MKRISVLVAVILVCGFVSNAKTVDIDIAKSVGYKFLTQQNNVIIKSPSDINLVFKSGKYPECFYVFSNNNCFVIVSADDAVIPILGYGTDQPFSYNNLPPSINDLFEVYNAQIIYAIKNRIEPEPLVTEKWNELINGKTGMSALKVTKTTSVINPLTSTTWNQFPGYNDLCPYDASCPNIQNFRCVAGCVATSMAQIMYYWQWPTNGSGSNSYTSYSYHYGPLSVDFAADTYDYASMPLYSSSAAVATLMYDAGVSVNMDYGCGGSGAYVNGGYPSAQQALVNNFCYSSTLSGLSRQDYDDATWINVIENELIHGRPVLYTGHNSSEGHAWVVDGHNASDYFHCNWGWGGSSDGYYYMNNMNPGGIPLNNYQTAIINIQPPVTITGADSVSVGSVISLNSSGLGGTWSCSNTLATVDGSGNLTGNFVGVDTIYYTSINSCGILKSRKVVNIVPTVQVHNNVTNNNRIQIYPNPNNGDFTLEANNNNTVTVIVYNALGVEIYRSTFANATSKSIHIDLANKILGFYICKIITENNVYTENIIVR